MNWRIPSHRQSCAAGLALVLLGWTGRVSLRADSQPAPAFSVPRAVVVAPGPVWKRNVIDDTSRGADGVKLGDLDGNGRLDLVTGWEEGGEVRVYLHPGPEAVRQPWPRVTAGHVGDPEDALFVDLDGDGHLDVVSCTEGRTRTVYWHRFLGPPGDWLKPERWSTAAFPATQGAQMWMQAVSLDLDGEHGPDLVVGSKGPEANVGWLTAPPRPAQLEAWTFHALRKAGWIMSLIPRDMDDDGDMDLAFTDRRGKRTGAFWLENPGPVANRAHAPWREHPIGGLGREVMFADLADVNEDGRLDAAIAAEPRDIVLCLRQPDGGWSEQVLTLNEPNIGRAKAVKVADVNRDGWPDLVFTCEGAAGEREGIIWLERQPQGTWRQRPLGGPAGVKFDLMQVLDLDEDGDLDVITCEETEGLGVIWYENPTLDAPIN